MSYDGNFMRFDKRFQQISESGMPDLRKNRGYDARFRQVATSKATDYPTDFLKRVIGSRLRKVGDFAIRSTRRLRDVSDFAIKDKDFAMWMGILGVGALAGGFGLGVYLGDKLSLMGKAVDIVSQPSEILNLANIGKRLANKYIK